MTTPATFTAVRMRPPRAFAAAALTLLSVLPLAAWQGAQAAPRFESQTYMIPARDGVKLHTVVVRPARPSGPLPFLIVRTPYGADRGAKGLMEHKELPDDQYLFVYQDLRGRYKSEGAFVMMRPVRDRRDAKAIDESTDAYDTVEWLVRNVAGNNGRAGIHGVSYAGWTTVMAMIEPHPAVKAVSQQASPADMFIGDDFHHNGAFRLSYGFEYAAQMETGKENYSFPFDRVDTFEWYLNLGPLSRVNEIHFRPQRPTWNDFVNHPNYDEFWQRQAVAPWLGEPKVPNLNVAGWWDQEDYYGPLKIYATMEKKDRQGWNFIVIGPWNHGGWNGDGRSLGQIEFGSDTGRHFRDKIEAAWFSYWLKDRGSLPFKEAMTFRTGVNEWQATDKWPPVEGVERRKLYLGEGRTLSFDPPAAERGADSYISDPENPVPYRRRPILPTYGGPGWGPWLVEDQRFVHRRPDVLDWSTGPLESNIVVGGDVAAHLFAATSGSDSDWVVKLIDVYPEKDEKLAGYQLMIANDVFRGRFRESFETPKPLEPNRAYEYTIDMHAVHHTFRKGHRMMVQVQSTWFPLIDRNPQRYVPNIFLAKAEDYQKATQTVYRTRSRPSHLELPVMGR
jgi:putative CocE/NonD family hydrolase